MYIRRKEDAYFETKKKEINARRKAIQITLKLRPMQSFKTQEVVRLPHIDNDWFAQILHILLHVICMKS